LSAVEIIYEILIDYHAEMSQLTHRRTVRVVGFILNEIGDDLSIFSYVSTMENVPALHASTPTADAWAINTWETQYDDG
jgi:hypothetical protein